MSSSSRHTYSVQSADPNLRLLNSFLDYLKVEKGLAPLSVSAYHSDLEQYSEFLLKRKRALREARRQDVRDFLNQLLSNGVDGRSVARKLSALRHFYKYLLLDRYITADPTLNIDTPRQWKVLPKSLASDELESVLKGPPRAKDDRRAQALTSRDRAMLEVFYAGALRVSEIINLKLEDLKLESGYVLVHGKGDKERIVPLGQSGPGYRAAVSARGRLELAAGKSSPFLFIARGGKPITRQRVWQMVSAASAQGAVTPVHTCCGTAARLIWSRTAPTYVPCKPFWDMPTFRPRRCTRTWPWTGLATSTNSIIRGARSAGLSAIREKNE